MNEADFLKVNMGKVKELQKRCKCDAQTAKDALEKREYLLDYAAEFIERKKLDDPKILTDNARYPKWNDLMIKRGRG